MSPATTRAEANSPHPWNPIQVVRSEDEEGPYWTVPEYSGAKFRNYDSAHGFATLCAIEAKYPGHINKTLAVA